LYLANLEFESDEALIKLAQQGEHEAAQALILRYQGRVKFLVRKYFLPGSERDDVLQEGYAALYQAILTFDGEKASFPTFASTVVRRQLITRIRAEQNRKRRVTGNTISLETRRFVNDEELPTIEDTLADRKERLPEDVLIELETIEDINRTAREKLTDYEWAVFVGR
jgi:RNA polymerase sporulation-specific sigma factor